MKNKKIIIIILAVVLSLILLASILNKGSSYIILDNKVINYSDGQFIDKDFSKVKNLYFNIFYDEKYIGKYYAESITDDNIYYTNNKSESSYNFKSPYIAITNDFKYIHFEYEDAEEEDFEFFKNNYDTIVSFEEIDEYKKAYVDIDDDGKEETIFYIIYNDMENTNSFSVTYIVDAELMIINENLYQNNEFGTSRVYYILKRNNKTFLITNTYYMEDNEYNIYMYTPRIKKLY